MDRPVVAAGGNGSPIPAENSRSHFTGSLEREKQLMGGNPPQSDGIVMACLGRDSPAIGTKALHRFRLLLEG
jgi:hypothetical protein